MKLSARKIISITVIPLFFINLISCAANKSNEGESNIPVSWSAGFTMPSLLDSPDVKLNSKTDLPKLINAPWYASIKVNSEKGDVVELSSCSDYFDKEGLSTRTAKDNEMNSYLEFKVMCEATRLLIRANSSKESFLPNTILSDAIPESWPKEIALQISDIESNRNNKNSNLKTWADVTPITKVEENSKVKSTYFHDGGYQEVQVVGKGDVNNDSIQDVIVVINEYVEGGSYFNIRLFALSADAEGSWKLIKEF